MCPLLFVEGCRGARVAIAIRFSQPLLQINEADEVQKVSQGLTEKLVRLHSTLDRINAPNMKALEKLVDVFMILITRLVTLVVVLCGCPLLPLPPSATVMCFGGLCAVSPRLCGDLCGVCGEDLCDVCGGIEQSVQ